MLAPYLRPSLSSSLPVLYLMAPMRLYGTPVLEAAREFPFSSLTGCPVRLLVCEDLYRGNKEWFSLWPEVRRQAAYGVFLDHLGGWVARGTWAETAELMALGRPVWWWCGGQPTDRFGFGPAGGDWRGRYRRVTLGYRRPCLETMRRPIDSGRPLTSDRNMSALECSMTARPVLVAPNRAWEPTPTIATRSESLKQGYVRATQVNP